MSYWMCTVCDYVFESEAPTEECPSCGGKCVFADVSCYIPECGGPDNLNQELIARRVREAKEGKI